MRSGAIVVAAVGIALAFWTGARAEEIRRVQSSLKLPDSFVQPGAISMGAGEGDLFVVAPKVSRGAVELVAAKHGDLLAAVLAENYSDASGDELVRGLVLAAKLYPRSLSKLGSDPGKPVRVEVPPSGDFAYVYCVQLLPRVEPGEPKLTIAGGSRSKALDEISKSQLEVVGVLKVDVREGRVIGASF